ncbi:four-carbon acid sugar kinase family protein [Streptomyces sp. TR06-5]|uniref:four-carbon acid sugar kinase family protein n=1 Tax=Streptomyces sp. TR06-5 TaxID=3385976 RepID=UPI0039A1E5AC
MTASAPELPVLAVADDLTGANATAAGFARAGLRAVTVGADRPPSLLREFTDRFDVVVVSTDSRHHGAAEAAARVTEVVGKALPATLVCDRVDSTLRGNVGPSAAAALHAVRRTCGARVVALCAPAHPAAGRQTVEGTQLLSGTRLEETELARDPRTPVHASEVAALFAPSGLTTAHLPLSAVTGPAGALEELVARHVHEGADVVVADALTEDHLRRTARAAVAAGGGNTRWISVDPGPGSVALAAALGITGRRARSPVLAVSGSTTALTRAQLARLRTVEPVTVVRPQGTGPGVVPDPEATGDALAAALADTGPDGTVLLATVLDGSDVRHPDPDEAQRLPAALARAVRHALRRHTVDGVFTTGGDVSAALLAALDADGLDVREEIEPLAVAGTLVGGPWKGLQIATKGGLVGDTDTTTVCVQQLRRAAAAARRQVPAASGTGNRRTT